MSMPFINLNCAKCNYSAETTILWGKFKYVYEQGECYISRRMAWCYQCKKLVPCENFDNSDEIFNDLTKAVESIERQLLSPVSLTLTKKSKKYKKYDLNQVRSLSKKLQINAERKGSEKCLNCGSSKITFFDSDYHLQYESDNFTGAKHTGFKHPGCGGEIIATPNPILVHMRFIPKYYTVDGDKIDSTEEGV